MALDHEITGILEIEESYPLDPVFWRLVRTVRLGSWLFGTRGCLLVQPLNSPRQYKLPPFIIIEPQFRGVTKLPLADTRGYVYVYAVDCEIERKTVFTKEECPRAYTGVILPPTTTLTK